MYGMCCVVLFCFAIWRLYKNNTVYVVFSTQPFSLHMIVFLRFTRIVAGTCRSFLFFAV